MKRNEIIINNGTDYKRMTIEVLNVANLAEDIGSRSARIGIKPNLVVASTAAEGAITHPEILDGVITYLQDNGFTNLVVAEGSWVGEKTSRAVKYSGIEDICINHNVKFVDLQKDGYRSVDAKGMMINLCNSVLEMDYLINLPVLKGHCQTKLTCALKNMKGLIPNVEKRKFHTLGLHRPIAHLNTCLPQEMIIVDNICGDIDFEEGGNPVTMNRILCFKDPVLCDAFACKTLGLNLSDVPYISMAEALGVGSTDLDKAELITLNDSSSVTAVTPASGRARRLSAFVDDDMSCSACFGMLIHALDKLERSGKLNNKLKVCIGQGFRGKEGEIGIGSCTSRFKTSLSGCPPTAEEILEFLKTVI